MTGGCSPQGTAPGTLHPHLKWYLPSAPPSPEVVLALPVLEDDGLVVGQLDALAQLDHLLVLRGEEQLRREGGRDAAMQLPSVVQCSFQCMPHYHLYANTGITC